MHIQIIVSGGDEHSRGKVGERLRDGLKSNMSATAWTIEGQTVNADDEIENRFRYRNEGWRP